MSEITTPLILSVISLAATIITTLVGAYITYYSDERKARREANKILLKYRDPLLLAAQDLQTRCFGLCDEKQNILPFQAKEGEGATLYHDTLYIYTAYVIGQYLSWTWILRRQAQFVALVSSNPPALWRFSARSHASSTTSLMQKISDIKAVFSNDGHVKEKPFMLFKADQQIIGEIMSCQDKNGEYYCMGYATFVDRWKNGAPNNKDENGAHKAAEVVHSDHDEKMAGISKLSDQRFRAHFKVIEDGIKVICDQHKASHPTQYPQPLIRPTADATGYPDVLSRPAADAIEYPDLLTKSPADGRLRRLQHLLLDLEQLLDASGKVQNQDESNPLAPAASDCKCSLRSCQKARKNSGSIVTPAMSNARERIMFPPEATFGARDSYSSHEHNARPV